MAITRRTFFPFAVAVFGLGAIGGYAFYRSPRSASFEKSLAIWLNRFRPHLAFAPIAATYYSSHNEAREFLERQLGLHAADDTVESWVEALEKARAVEFAAGQATYLDGWPFAPVEVALLSIARRS